MAVNVCQRLHRLNSRALSLSGPIQWPCKLNLIIPRSIGRLPEPSVGQNIDWKLCNERRELPGTDGTHGRCCCCIGFYAMLCLGLDRLV